MNNQGMDRLLNDLGITEPKEETGKLLQLPRPVYMYSNMAIRTHLRNLFATYGKDAVIYHLTEMLQADEKTGK